MPRPTRVALLSAFVLAFAAFACYAADDEDVKVPPVKHPGGGSHRDKIHSQADIPEMEPNGSIALAQALGCGNALNPASLANVGTPRDSDWVSFTANVGDLVTFYTDFVDILDPETDTVISLADGLGNILATNDDDPAGGTLWSFIENFSIPATGTYYGRIRGFAGAQGPYQAVLVCQGAPPPPPNDDCATAIDIPCGPIAIAGTTSGALNNYDLCPGSPVCASCTGFYSPGLDVVYKITAGVGASLDVTYTQIVSSVDASFYLVTDCGDVAASCIAGQDSDTGTPPEQLLFTFSTPGTYYLVVDAFTPAGGDFTLTGTLDCSTKTRATSTWGQVKSFYR